MSKNTRLAVQYTAIKAVKPSKHNARNHPPEQVKQIAASIQEFGWTKPIVVDEKQEILAGHGAYQAALQIGMTEVPVIVHAGLTAAQKRAYRTADNKIGENSIWDDEVLKAEFADLQAMGFDLTLTAFTPGEIEDLLRPPTTTDPEPPQIQPTAPATTKLGDVWQLGDHRLICADSTKPNTYQELMAGRQAAMVFTDPPYGVSYGEGRPPDRHPKRFKAIEGDQHRRGDLVKLLTAAFAAAMPNTGKAAPWYIWHGLVTRRDFETAIQSVGLIEPPNGYIVWVKPPTMGWSDYKSAFEPCFYVHQQGNTPPFYGDRTQATTWQAAARTAAGAAVNMGNGVILTSDAGEIHIGPPPNGKTVRHENLAPGESVQITAASDSDNVWLVGRGKEGEDTIHPTQKPVELARRAIRNSSQEGEIVLDLFAGSGSTLMGAEQTRRCCYAVELEPTYVDAIVRRWQKATGKHATHAKDQKTFEAVSKARAGKAK